MRAAKEVDRGSYCDIRTPWFLRSARFLAVAGRPFRFACRPGWTGSRSALVRAALARDTRSAEGRDLLGVLVRAVWSRVSCHEKMRVVVSDVFVCRI
jgi:hypothetical protein